MQRKRSCEGAQVTFERYDISAVGRMKFNRRIGRKATTGPSVLYDSPCAGC